MAQKQAKQRTQQATSPSCRNLFVRTPYEAALLMEACFGGFVKAYDGRASRSSREIQSGDVFIYRESSGRIRRWTDGRHWSPSRKVGSFFTYRETRRGSRRTVTVASTTGDGQKKKCLDGSGDGERGDEHDEPVRRLLEDAGVSEAEVLRSPYRTYERVRDELFGSLVGQYDFVRDGLVKRIIKFAARDDTYRVVSYYRIGDVIKNGLGSPADRFGHLPLRPWLRRAIGGSALAPDVHGQAMPVAVPYLPSSCPQPLSSGPLSAASLPDVAHSAARFQLAAVASQTSSPQAAGSRQGDAQGHSSGLFQSLEEGHYFPPPVIHSTKGSDNLVTSRPGSPPIHRPVKHGQPSVQSRIPASNITDPSSRAGGNTAVVLALPHPDRPKARPTPPREHLPAVAQLATARLLQSAPCSSTQKELRRELHEELDFPNPLGAFSQPRDLDPSGATLPIRAVARHSLPETCTRIAPDSALMGELHQKAQVDRFHGSECSLGPPRDLSISMVATEATVTALDGNPNEGGEQHGVPMNSSSYHGVSLGESTEATSSPTMGTNTQNTSRRTSASEDRSFISSPADEEETKMEVDAEVGVEVVPLSPMIDPTAPTYGTELDASNVTLFEDVLLRYRCCASDGCELGTCSAETFPC